MSDKPYVLMVEIDGEYYVTRDDAAKMMSKINELQQAYDNLKQRSDNWGKSFAAERRAALSRYR